MPAVRMCGASSGAAVLRAAACTTSTSLSAARGGRNCLSCMRALPGGNLGSGNGTARVHSQPTKTGASSLSVHGGAKTTAFSQAGREESVPARRLGGGGGGERGRGSVVGGRAPKGTTSCGRLIGQGVVVMGSGGWRSFLSAAFGGGSGGSAGPAQQQNSRALDPDDTVPAPGCELVSLGAGCFWGVELAFQRVPGVTKTAVGYAQGRLDNPAYEDVCSGATGHAEVVLVEYDPQQTSLETVLDVFWSRHDPTQLNRQGNDVGTQYRSGIYFYTPEQEAIAKRSLQEAEARIGRKIVTEILPARKFYRAEEYHQQYLAKGGRLGFKQSAAKGCNDPIRCYG